MPSRLFSVFLCSILLREAALAETPIQPQKQVLPAETTLRVQSFARERYIVKNPLNQAQILYRIPEGSRVAEGDLLFVFDMSAPEEAMVTQQQKLDATTFRIRKSRANRDDELRTLTEKIEEVEDEIALLEARMAYLRSLPRAEDVLISVSSEGPRARREAGTGQGTAGEAAQPALAEPVVGVEGDAV